MILYIMYIQKAAVTGCYFQSVTGKLVLLPSTPLVLRPYSGVHKQKHQSRTPVFAILVVNVCIYEDTWYRCLVKYRNIDVLLDLADSL